MLQALVESSKFPMKQHLLRHWYLLFVVNTGSKTDGEYKVQESCTRCCQAQRMYLAFPLYGTFLVEWFFRCLQVTGLEALWMPHGPDQGAGPMVSGTWISECREIRKATRIQEAYDTCKGGVWVQVKVVTLHETNLTPERLQGWLKISHLFSFFHCTFC